MDNYIGRNKHPKLATETKPVIEFNKKPDKVYLVLHKDNPAIILGCFYDDLKASNYAKGHIIKPVTVL